MVGVYVNRAKTRSKEVRDVDALASPEDAEEDLPDWGPGAPKP